jgi:hypothetical protein
MTGRYAKSEQKTVKPVTLPIWPVAAARMAEVVASQ